MYKNIKYNNIDLAIQWMTVLFGLVDRNGEVMEDYNNISNELKKEIKEIAKRDAYGLNPVTLYRNIKYSSGSDESISSIFDVSITLVQKIKEGE